MAAAETTTSSTGTMSAAMKTYYIDRFLSHFKEITVLQGKGQAADIPIASGKTVDWWRYKPAALVTSAGTEGLLGSDATYKSFAGFNVTATLETWYDQFRFSELLQLTARDKRLEAAANLVAQQAAESIERETLRLLCETNIWPLPANAINSSTGALNDSVYNEDVTIDSMVDKGNVLLTDATLTITSNTLSDDILIGGWCCVSRGSAYGFCSRISDYDSASRELTLSDSAPEAFQSKGYTYPTYCTITSPYLLAEPLASGDVMTTEILQKAEEILFKNGATPFDDGNFICAIHPINYRYLLNDTTFVAGMQNSRLEGLQNNDMGIWSRCRFMRMTTPARYAIPGSEPPTKSAFSSTAGRIYTTLVFGKDAYGVVALSGHGEPQLKIAIPNANDNNTENPNSLYGTMGWKLYWKVQALNANFMVGIFTYV